MIIVPPFGSELIFSDPSRLIDGKPLGIIEYKKLVQYRYWISKHTHTSYLDTGSITPIQREYLLQFIAQEIQKKQEALDEAKNK